MFVKYYLLCFSYYSYVLDGYPVLDRQIQFLTKRNIIPYKVIEMKVDSETTFSRADSDRKSPNRYCI